LISSRRVCPITPGGFLLETTVLETTPMNTTQRHGWLSVSVLAFTIPAALAQDKPLTPEELEFFETKIRPALIEHCHKCHSGDKDAKVKGGLQVDSRAALLKGGSSGAAIVAGNPQRSLLYKAISYTDPNLQMPPKDKLPDNVVSDFESWIRMGAPDPRTGKAAGILKSEADKEKAKQHWSFKPIKKPEVPKPKSHLKTWIQNDVDIFVLAKLEEKGLLPTPPADKWTLIRRAYFDLIGMPPSPEEVEAFINDESPEAWSKVLDKLLASKHYGERWGRYWLDVARYADTRGANNNNQRMGNVMTQAYTYRDWVVNAFNDDLPYDRFLIYQIAADKATEEKKHLAAMGLLTLSRQANAVETIDDRIDVITRGMMSFSVYCARCHDHKFDPIPTADYYSLHGVFASCAEPGDRPIVESDTESPEYKDYIRQMAKIDAELEGYRMSNLAKHLGEARANTARYMQLAHGMIKDPEKQLRNRADQQTFENMYKLDQFVMNRWVGYLKARTDEKDPVWGPWAMYHKLDDKDFAAKGKDIAAKFVPSNDASKTFNSLVARSFSTSAANMAVVAERYAKLFADAEKAWSSAVTLNEKKKASAKEGEKVEDLKSLPDSAMDALRRAYLTGNAPAAYGYDQVANLNNNRIRNGENQFNDARQKLEVQHPGAPKRAMTLMDRGTLVNSPIAVKGDPRNPGKVVPRQFLEVLSGPDRKPFTKGSGRLELAQAIASDKNPLTARVAVNRVWMNHFGAPLVRTPTDFGVRAEDPTHPELLDYLASYLIENGWSIKKLHKFVMMSNVYQQGSDDRGKAMALDPANLLVWKMNRRRLDFESFRDSLLLISGKLKDEMGGPPVNIANRNDPLHTFDPYRRTIYAKVDRGNLATVFRTFDFANPDITTGQRFNSTVPQQALYMMNSDFITQLAREVVNRTDFKKDMDERQRIVQIYQIAFQRPPTDIELKLGHRFLEEQSGIKSTGPATAQVWRYGYGQYDPANRRVVNFFALPVFDGRAWLGDPKDTAKPLGPIKLDAAGGTVGTMRGIAVIRRWTAPRDVSVAIDGTIGHQLMRNAQGDGVNAYIAASGRGELGRYLDVRNKTAYTTVAKVDLKKGDTIDFIVDAGSKGNWIGDTFTWAPTIRVVGAPAMMSGNMASTEPASANEWRAGADFNRGGSTQPAKPLNTWEKYAQVLLLANEMAFLD
jgi:hypothetical protein